MDESALNKELLGELYKLGFFLSILIERTSYMIRYQYKI